MVKNSIINVSSYSSKHYAYVALGDSKVAFLWKKEDAAFLSISLLCFVA